nr:unnamed protein product [Callosobruchus chinensis]
MQRRREKQKRLWLHPIVSERLLVGAFGTLRVYSKLRQDEIKFFNHFRMSIKSFDELHHKLIIRYQFYNYCSSCCLIAAQLNKMATGRAVRD